jgi:hypothetical protein
VTPWIKGASVEEDPDLHEMWESLLANAGDPRDGRKETHRSFVRILKQLEAPEQKVLEALYRIDAEVDEYPFTVAGVYPDNEEIRDALIVIGAEEEISDGRLNMAKINLTRLGLCSRGGNRILGGGGSGPFSGGGSNPPEPQEGPSNIHISDFGRVFYEACQPPESEEN